MKRINLVLVFVLGLNSAHALERDYKATMRPRNERGRAVPARTHRGQNIDESSRGESSRGEISPARTDVQANQITQDQMEVEPQPVAQSWLGWGLNGAGKIASSTLSGSLWGAKKIGSGAAWVAKKVFTDQDQPDRSSDPASKGMIDKLSSFVSEFPDQIQSYIIPSTSTWMKIAGNYSTLALSKSISEFRMLAQNPLLLFLAVKAGNFIIGADAGKAADEFAKNQIMNAVQAIVQNRIADFPYDMLKTVGIHFGLQVGSSAYSYFKKLFSSDPTIQEPAQKKSGVKESRRAKKSSGR